MIAGNAIYPILGVARVALSAGLLVLPLLSAGRVAAAVEAVEGQPATETPQVEPGREAFHADTPIIQDLPPHRRPRFSMALGMGISRDASGLTGPRTVSIPAFQAQIGAGDGLLGFEMSLFSNQAAGRYHEKAPAGSAANALPADMAVDRLALDLMAAVRPLTYRFRDTSGWLARVARSVTVDLGLGAEHCSVGPPSAFRWGSVVGVHVDLPVTPGLEAADLRLRFGGRRSFAHTTQVGAVSVADTKGELFGGLALVF